MVNVYILVTSVTPLTSFLHDIVIVTTNEDRLGHKVKVKHLSIKVFVFMAKISLRLLFVCLFLLLPVRSQTSCFISSDQRLPIMHWGR